MAMQEWFDAMAARDINAVMATYHEDFFVCDERATVYSGRHEAELYE